MEKPIEIEVGIMTAKDIRITELPESGTFLVHDVVIGKEFHWERKENQEFKGKYKILDENGEKTLVNILPLEDYLESVIASEMASTSDLEFLKAHAVISRSWLLAQIGYCHPGPDLCHPGLDPGSPDSRRRLNQVDCFAIAIKSGMTEIKSAMTEIRSAMTDEPATDSFNEYIRWYDREDHANFDVCADDHCQRYQGVSRISSPLVTQAIRETKGEVLMYEDRICDTRFSKCCGGKTETFENTWGNESHPYLISINDQIGLGDDFCNTKDITVLSQVLNNYDQETSDFYEWTVVYSQEQLSDLLERKTSFDFGRIVDLIPIERGESGRIIRLKIVGTKQTKVIGKELFIRKALSESHLYSSDFQVEKQFDSNSSEIPSGFILSGKGWGHGVGLCQIGAAVMATKGYSYQEILKHYFPLSKLLKNYGQEE
ncbi:SpoIID/LytB domain-containing protein [Bacteroidales bacterium OttesenSCG-928-A17]|nr:SpoIID/LytB domain-containing protein [Bacteroidales bacterium OttesenSCG-928-A17]